MYFVFKSNRKTKHSFTTYEQARQFIRKQIRKLNPNWKLWDGNATNPLSIHDYGYKIKFVG